MSMPTARLAQLVIDTPTSALPDALLDAARDAVMDTLSVGLAGVAEPVSELVAQWTDENAGRPAATVWGRGNRASVAEAAFANAIAAHALDFDDTLPTIRGHPSAVLVPTALAVAEDTGSSGKAVLAAYVIGLEVAGKLGRAANEGLFRHGWHTTPTLGIFAATAVAARLWGLNADALQRAWGLAASQVGGLMRNFGTMTKPFHAGHAARCGLFSAWMAKRGFTADAAILDGGKGVFATYGKTETAALDAALAQWGAPWEINSPGVYVKEWPCCYCNHRPIGGLLQLIKQHDLDIDDIKMVSVGFLPGSDDALLSDNPQTGLEGKFSIQYSMAATLLDRQLTFNVFTVEMVQRPRIRELMQRVKRYRIEDSKIYSGVVGYTDVTVETPRGSFNIRVDKTPGSPDWPLSAESRALKFLDCSGRALGDAGARRLFDLARDLRALPDVRKLMRATVPDHAVATRERDARSVAA